MTESKTLIIGFLLEIFCTIASQRSAGPTYSKQNFGKKQVLPVLRIMTFNLWHSGDEVKNGLEKIAKHILHVNPDIVALQEVMSKEHLNNLTALMGPEWSAVCRSTNPDCNTMPIPDSGILTKHKILREPNCGAPFETCATIRSKIKINLGQTSFTVNVWSLHIFWSSYGPYAACNKLVSDKYQILAGEVSVDEKFHPGRLPEMQFITNTTVFLNDLSVSNEEPLIVMGDFNSPSHLDWIESTKHLHCGWTFEWPATKILSSFQLTDAFRQVYNSPLKVPGITWSTVVKYNKEWGGTIFEPQDRIDMIFYKGNLLQPSKAKVYFGNQLITLTPYHKNNDWPSDHASVIVDFIVGS